jgi:hypothetical protein
VSIDTGPPVLTQAPVPGRAVSGRSEGARRRMPPRSWLRGGCWDLVAVASRVGCAPTMLPADARRLAQRPRLRPPVLYDKSSREAILHVIEIDTAVTGQAPRSQRNTWCGPRSGPKALTPFTQSSNAQPLPCRTPYRFQG